MEARSRAAEDSTGWTVKKLLLDDLKEKHAIQANGGCRKRSRIANLSEAQFEIRFGSRVYPCVLGKSTYESKRSSGGTVERR